MLSCLGAYRRTAVACDYSGHEVLSFLVLPAVRILAIHMKHVKATSGSLLFVRIYLILISPLMPTAKHGPLPYMAYFVSQMEGLLYMFSYAYILF